MNVLDEIKNGVEDLAKEHSVAKIDIDPGDGEDETTGGNTISSSNNENSHFEIRKPNLLEQHVSEFSNSDGVGINVSNPPTSAQKWWISIVLGVIYFLIASPIAYKITGGFFESIGGMNLFTFKDIYPGQTLVALIVHTIIFILIVRLILW
jgi:hypothetical protein